MIGYKKRADRASEGDLQFLKDLYAAAREREMLALLDWGDEQKREFLEVERKYAQVWRRALSDVDLGKIAETFISLGFDASVCRSLEEAKALADRQFGSDGCSG